MTYREFKKANISLAAFGLEERGTRSDYLCAPKFTRALYFTGVDGIHYAFVRGFAEMVFAISPANIAGECVHPVARDFGDFLALLAASGEAAMEQAWRWSRAQFDTFMEEYPLSPEQLQTAKALRAIGIEPCADPYGYIRAVQAEFDDSRLSYRKEYLACIPTPAEALPEWRVTFAGGFFPGKKEKPGEEISVGQAAFALGEIWHIPAIYRCTKGIVVELIREGGEREAPAFTAVLTADGEAYAESQWSGIFWVPKSGVTDARAEQVLAHYGLDRSASWELRRISFACPRRKFSSLTLTLRPLPVESEAARFTAEVGKAVRFVHPETGLTHTLTVTDFAPETVSLPPMPGMELPRETWRLSYRVTPPLARGDFAVRDVAESDPPRKTGGASDGPAGILTASREPDTVLAALHVTRAESVTWRVTVRGIPGESCEVKLL